jgi:tetratricopeptide (TPR) repeat protein
MVSVLLIPAMAGHAQQSNETTTTEAIPAAYQLPGMTAAKFEFQRWNNCGPATLTNALDFFGYSEDQTRAADWLKPDGEDKNVSPWQMVEFVNTQLPDYPATMALSRAGGDATLLKTLIASDFPVIIEKGYDPEPERLGWMGHYLLVVGYDDGAQVFTTHDSYIGANYNYSYEYIVEYWQHFNYTYMVLFQTDRHDELLNLLGEDPAAFDPATGYTFNRQNTIDALEIARAEASANNDDAFAWFNMGTNFSDLGMYKEAAQAYDEARRLGLPYRMLWYQFGPYEAYYQQGRYDDMIVLAQRVLNDGGGHFVEETYYYGGLAREGKGEYERALRNYETAIQFNPNFTPAIEARDELQAQLNNA